MALQSFQLDPSAGGVSQATFDNHSHNYRMITRLGVDDRDQFDSPDYVDIVDDSENVAASAVDVEAVGITVATSATSAPI